MEFSQRLAELKSEKRCSNDAIAKACGVSEGAVRSWLNGSKVPGADKVKAMAVFFSVSVDYLLGRDEKKLLTNNDEELVNAIIMSRDGKTVRRKYTKEQRDALRILLENMPFIEDEEL